MDDVFEHDTLKQLIEESFEFSLVNKQLEMGVLNESYVVSELCHNRELNNYIFDAILYLNIDNKEYLLNNTYGLRLFIAILSKKGIPKGISIANLELIAKKIITIKDSLNIYMYGEFIRDSILSNNDKWNIIKLLTIGISNTTTFNHQVMFIENIIKKMEIDQNSKNELISLLIMGILNSNNLSLIAQFLFIFNRVDNEIFIGVDKNKVYEKVVEIALKNENERLMVNLSYLDFSNENANIIGDLILKSNDVFFVYCFTRKFLLFNRELQDKYVAFLTEHVNDYENLKSKLQTFLQNPYETNNFKRRIVR